jgi:gliding motility-associated-like protein
MPHTYFFYLVLFFTHFTLFFSFGQMFVQGSLYLGSEYELYTDFEQNIFEQQSFVVDRNGGVFSFSEKAKWDYSDVMGFIDGGIRKYKPDNFSFPTGHGAAFQPVQLSLSGGINFIEVTFYALGHTQNTLGLNLEKIHSEFYWTLNSTSGNGQLTFSWNTDSQIGSFLDEKGLETLSVVGLKDTHWEVISSAVDLNSFLDFSPSTELSGSISTNEKININDYSAFSLGIKKEGVSNFNNIRVAEGITPNNDGRNDTWIIEGIEAYPEAQIYVYNRLGKVVFAALNGYDNAWANNFNSNDEPLPAGPYFFTIDLDADGVVDKQGWIYINY